MQKTPDDPSGPAPHPDQSAPASPGDATANTTSADVTPPAGHRNITAGEVLWTLTQRDSTAQARRWITPVGFEFEMQIWTGTRVEGQEDLCWSQLFVSEEALADLSRSKKRQLEAAGWLEQIDANLV